jgi:hypothetical protein
LPLFPSDSGQGVEGLARDQWAPSSVAVLIVHIPPIMVVVILDTDVWGALNLYHPAPGRCRQWLTEQSLSPPLLAASHDTTRPAVAGSQGTGYRLRLALSYNSGFFP